MLKDTSTSSRRGSLGGARHLSCEGCRKRKMKCSRTDPCVQCSLRSEECVWIDTRPSQGVSSVTLEENMNEIRRLCKVINQLQAVIVEREGRPFFPPAVAPPTPPSYHFNEWAPPLVSYGAGMPRGTSGASKLDRPYDTSSTYASPPTYPDPPHRSDASFDYPAPRQSGGEGYDPHRSTSSFAASSHQPSLPFHPSQPPSQSYQRPGLNLLSGSGWTYSPHSRAATWNGPLPSYNPSPSSHSFHQDSHHSTSFQHSYPSTTIPPSFPPPSHMPSAGTDLVSAEIAASLPVSAPATTGMSTGEIMRSQLPQLDTNVSLNLPETVSGLLNFDVAAAVAGGKAAGGEGGIAGAEMGVGAVDGGASEQQERVWGEYPGLSENHA
ncbi:hypothetical protein JCM8547_007630 [Rhodosporidiobolus lusitaniae]